MPSPTVTQASRLAGVNPVHLYRLLAQGRLTGEKDPNGHWLLDMEPFQRWLQQHLLRKRRCQQQ